ncbi:MAG: fibronectin type III domain-containing protein [Lachnospiraceae bacterium]|nr:fibronectin type III domain-containing protein [Lachnospiraceae bacterium]
MTTYTSIVTVSFRSAGNHYTYKVSAIFTNSKGQVTKGGAKTTKAAKYLTAGSISSLSNTSSGIYIKWPKVTGATGYYVYRKASSASSYTLVKTITGVGTTSYTDTAVKSSNNTTYTYYTQPYFKNSSRAITKAGYSTKAIVRLVAPAISSLTNSSSKTMTVKWGAKSGVTGYQVQYSASSSFASGNKTLTITGASSSSKVIASLTKGKTYYVRIRTYKTVNGTTYYSAWSTVKSVKISK